MINCNEAKDLMTLYIDKELDDFQCQKFKAHIKLCTQCSKELAETIEVVEMCRKIHQVPLPEDFKSQLREALIKEQDKEQKSGNKYSLKTKYLGIVSTVAAGLLLIVMLRGFFGDGFFNLSKGQLDKSNALEPEVNIMMSNEVQEGEEFAVASDDVGVRSFSAIENEEQITTREESIGSPPELIQAPTKSGRGFEKNRIFFDYSNGVENSNLYIEKVKEVAEDNGADFFDGEAFIVGLRTDIKQSEQSVVISFNIPVDSYAKFISDLNTITDPSNINILPMDKEIVHIVIKEMNLLLNDVIEEINIYINKAAGTGSNSEYYEYLLAKKSYLENELSKIEETSDFTLITIEFRPID